jgi:hypothetical protein
MGTKNKLTLVLVAIAVLVSQASWGGDAERRQAKRIHDRLTGVNATNATIDAMEALLLSDVNCPAGLLCGKDAAEYAIDTVQNPTSARYFYNVTLKNYASPWTNEEQTVFTPLNDYTATVIGLIRDGADFRRVLYDDVVYHANGVVANNYSPSNNLHYEQLEALGPIAGDLSSNAILGTASLSSVTPGLPATATAGVMTSRAGAMSFFTDGTNRAMFRFTLMNQLCTDLEPLKDVTRTPDRVRRDVSRSPGGDSRIYLNGCVGCHAGMDGMAGAFAHYEWDQAGNRLVYRDIANTALFDPVTGVSLKHLINPNNFEYGYVITDDSWVNYWRNGPNAKLGNRPGDNSPGWTNPGPVDGKGNAIGNGAKSLGVELANSKAFAQCQVDKAFKAICLRDPNIFSADRSARDGFVSNFTGSTYNMREVFTDVAAYCKGN